VGTDAQAFDEMVFGSKGRWLRWTQAPELVVLMPVMQYQAGESNVYAATSGELTDGEASQLVEELTAALGVLTSGVHTRFAGVRRERLVAGATTQVLRPGQIVVGRFQGVRDALQTVGLGGRTVRANGTIASGAILLDCDYDRTSSKRRLMRTHELGHALGYNHVHVRPSIMNASIGADLTDFDHQAAALTFRGPGAAIDTPLRLASAK
jgi:hypothetical protein